MNFRILCKGFIVYLSLSAQILCAEAEFDRIWEAISERSPALRSEVAEASAAEVRLLRANRHWLPKVSLGAGLVSTNSPNLFLFSSLGSRGLQSSDLNPSVVNFPERQSFITGSLNVDLPIYEGGSSAASARAAGLLQQSQELSKKARFNEVYADFVKQYSLVLALRKESKTISELDVKLKNLIDRYRVGSRDNPVGYSGLLGMKSLLNRLKGLASANEAEMESLMKALSIESGLKDLELVKFRASDAVTVASEKLQLTTQTTGQDLRASSMRVSAQAYSELAGAEKARWLPRVGLFATESLVSGPRNTGFSLDFGGYLQWQIFDGKNLGAYREASLRATASDLRAEEFTERSRISKFNSAQNLKALLGSLDLLKSSQTFTIDQTQVTEKLFRNGSVNALQFSEVLSRRVDLIESFRIVEREVINQLCESYLMNRSE